ncbi:MAG: hypothetical protein HY747_10370 [Elusimicrobia bacterium]|nr:hypothetical protein [Elusimicrobiota bacterium]
MRLLILTSAAAIFFTGDIARQHILRRLSKRAAHSSKTVFDSIYFLMSRGLKGNDIQDYLDGTKFAAAEAAAAAAEEEEEITDLTFVSVPDIGRQRTKTVVIGPRDEEERMALMTGKTVERMTSAGPKYYKQLRYVLPAKLKSSCLPCHKKKVGEVMGAASYTVSLRSTGKDTRLLQRQLGIILGAGIFIVGGVIFFLLNRFVLKPVAVVAAERARVEALQERAGELQALNQQLRASEQQLKAANQQLGAKEQALRSKMSDLERFNRLMVGRELRMVELKEEVNALLEKSGQPRKYEATEKTKGG